MTKRLFALMFALIFVLSSCGKKSEDTKSDKGAVDEMSSGFTLQEGGAVNIYYKSQNGSEIYAAHTLSLALGDKSTVTDGEAKSGIVIENGTDELGDCGYKIRCESGKLYISANTLTGYDNAFAALLTENSKLSFDEGFEVSQTIETEKDFTPEGDDYKSEYQNTPFYNDKNDSVAYVVNAMWRMFGDISDGQNLVYRFGNEPTYFEWMSEKIMWSGDEDYINQLKSKIIEFPQTSTGYLWSWATYPYWKVDDTYCIHYDGTFRYISAVYDVIAWEGSTDFLYQVDGGNAGGDYAAVDASEGRTVLEKTEAALDYLLNKLDGKNGWIQLTEKSVYLNEDGSERFDYVAATGEYCWDNTGLMGSAASNYWDNLCFGNYDAYENALFYQALNSMIGIYRMLGSDYEDKAAALEALAETVKTKYDELYWSEETGRYIACIDTEGNKVDYGLTFLNFEALKYGLGDADKAESILSWVDGTRIVEGDTSQGKDIMSYAAIMEYTRKRSSIKKWGVPLYLAPRINTVAINNAENSKTRVAWWHGPQGINVWGSAKWGYHCENGGYIFYPVFYELMARGKYLGADAVTERLRQIAEVYKFNRLNSDEAATNSASWLEGLIGEFPESGLVPTAYLYSLMGVNAESDGLYISPIFGDSYEYMGVTKLGYGGTEYALELNRNDSLTLKSKTAGAKANIHYRPNRFDRFTLTVKGADGKVIESQSIEADGNGYINVDLARFEAAAEISITPFFE